MIRRHAQIEEHFGYPVLRETESTTFVRVPVTGERLHQSILLYPRYIPKGIAHEVITARVFHRGRTLDIFLDEPFEIHGKMYGILNFKGVGADADREMVIHPSQWYLSSLGNSSWVPCHEGDPYGRMWGALTEEKARIEYTHSLFEQFKIPSVPHLSLNPLPDVVEQQILGIREREEPTLYQLVRAQQTNIRVADLWFKNIIIYVSANKIAEIDAQVIRTQLQLAKKGKMLRSIGFLRENRLIDGSFIDKENYAVDAFEISDATLFIQEIVEDTSFFSLVAPEMRQTYIEELQKRTRFPFQRLLDEYLHESIFRIVQRELEKVVSA